MSSDGRKGSRWARLTTEARHPEASELDLLPPEDMVGLLLEEDRRGIEQALALRSEIARAAKWLAETLAADRSVLMAGAGTSGRLGVLEAAECPPTFGTDPSSIRAVMAGGRDAVFEAVEGAEDEEDAGARIGRELAEGDLLIGISASSVTPFVRGALEGARRAGARRILLTCAPSTGVGGAADLVLALDTGPEILTGSTRLKAGSATKAALNAITTVAMVQLHKVYRNWMVDVRPGSAKLEDRQRRIVAAAGEVSPEAAQELLSEADGEVKVAILSGLTDASVDRAREALEQTGGRVRAALEALAAELR